MATDILSVAGRELRAEIRCARRPRPRAELGGHSGAGGLLHTDCPRPPAGRNPRKPPEVSCRLQPVSKQSPELPSHEVAHRSHLPGCLRDSDFWSLENALSARVLEHCEAVGLDCGRVPSCANKACFVGSRLWTALFPRFASRGTMDELAVTGSVSVGTAV